MKRFILAATVLAGLMGGGARSALAEDADYCAKVRARAASDAALLYSPSVQLQGIKYPAGAPGVVAVGGSESGDGYQARAALSYDLVGAYRSTMLAPLADRDCLQHSATTEVQNLLEQVADVGRFQALSDEVEYLTNHHSKWNEIAAEAQARVNVGSATVVDMLAVRTSVASLEKKLAEMQGQLQVLRAKNYVSNPTAVADIARRLNEYSMKYEHQQSKIRMLDPWSLSVSGGVVPPMMHGDPVSWYGMVQLQYNFGGLVRGHYENEYLAARQRELDSARYEVLDQLFRFERIVQANKVAISSEWGVVENHLTELYKTHNGLVDHIDAPTAAITDAVVKLQIMDTESDLAAMAGMMREIDRLYPTKASQ